MFPQLQTREVDTKIDMIRIRKNLGELPILVGHQRGQGVKAPQLDELN